MIPNHYRARHNQYKDLLPDSLKWIQNPDNRIAFDMFNTTIYYADENFLLLLMWHNDKIIVSIDLNIVDSKFNVLVTEFLARNETEASMDNIQDLIKMLSDQGLELSI